MKSSVRIAAVAGAIAALGIVPFISTAQETTLPADPGAAVSSVTESTSVSVSADASVSASTSESVSTSVAADGTVTTSSESASTETSASATTDATVPPVQ